MLATFYNEIRIKIDNMGYRIHFESQFGIPATALCSEVTTNK